MIRVLVACLLIVCAFPDSASADRGGHVTPGDNEFNALIEHVAPGSVLIGSSASNPAQQSDGTVVSSCDLNEVCSQMVCEATSASPTGGEYIYYDGSAAPLNLGWCTPAIPVQPQITPGVVAAAFRRIPLPGAELVVQPPNGRTLVNFETNFYTEQEEFTRSVRLLGRRVELRIWASAYGWRFGDGGSQQTTSPGSAYPDLEITHRYLRTGSVEPSVDVTYAAQFRVGGGPWRDVDGTVTISGERQQLRVVEARPVLVGG